MMAPQQQSASRSSTATSSSGSTSSGGAGASRFASLSDLQSSESSAKDDKQQKYYTGGSGTSGQQVLGPPGSGEESSSDLASKLLQKAKEAHARGETPAPMEPEKEKFSGSGRRLGSQRTDAGQSRMKNQDPNATQKPKYKKVKITFYADGFCIDDGELKSFTDPKNATLLDTINKGFVPHEIAEGAETVDVQLEDKKHEKYTPKAKRFEAFTTGGRTLGSSSSASSSLSSNTTPLTNYQVDTSRPHTTLQLRLPSGPVRQQFNLSDTIQTVRNFIAGTNSELSNGNFSLVLAVPPRSALTNANQTLEEAGLKNSALMVRKLG